MQKQSTVSVKRRKGMKSVRLRTEFSSLEKGRRESAEGLRATA